MLESAFSWVSQIIQWVGAFIPRWVILDSTEGAIKYVKGIPKYCCPGKIHWYWPVTTKWVEWPVARQTDRLETQTMETTDGKSFIVSGTLTYSVEDLSKLLPTTHDALTAVVEIAQTALHDVCCEMTWDELQLTQRKGNIKTLLKNAAQRELEDYGVKVIRFKLNSLARCRVIKISQTTASEENG